MSRLQSSLLKNFNLFKNGSAPMKRQMILCCSVIAVVLLAGFLTSVHARTYDLSADFPNGDAGDTNPSALGWSLASDQHDPAQMVYGFWNDKGNDFIGNSEHQYGWRRADNVATHRGWGKMAAADVDVNGDGIAKGYPVNPNPFDLGKGDVISHGATPPTQAKWTASAATAGTYDIDMSIWELRNGGDPRVQLFSNIGGVETELLNSTVHNGDYDRTDPMVLAGPDSPLQVSFGEGDFVRIDVSGNYAGINLTLTGGTPVPDSNEFTWSKDESGDWNSDNQWNINGSPRGPRVPNDKDHTAIFGDSITSTKTVFTDTPVTVGVITFANANSYAIAGRGGVNIEAGTSGASLFVLQGEHEFQTPVSLLTDADAQVVGGSTLIFNNALNLNGNTLTKSGGGELAIRNDLVTGGGTVSNQGGAVSGNGTIGGDLVNGGGVVSPGNSSSISSAVPEPGYFVMALLGMAGCLIRRPYRTVLPS